MANTQSYQGGLIASIQFSAVNPNSLISDTYSRATVKCASSPCGGFFSGLYFNTASNLTFFNVYSAANFTPPTGSYGLFGSLITFSATGFNVSFCNTFFLSQSNYPALGSGNSTNGILPLGLNCSQLYFQVGSSFEQGVWGGDRLRSKR